MSDPSDVDVRGGALYGAWLCGSSLGATTMGLHHQLAHILGGSFGLSHAGTHTVLLPHVLAFNTPAAPDGDEALRRALGTDRPAAALQALATELGAPTTLSELGFGEHDIEEVAQRAAAQPYANPRLVTADGVREVLAGALRGTQL